MKHGRIISGFIVAGVMSLSAAPVQASVFTRSTSEGVAVRLGSHATWDANCQGLPARVEIVEPPQHGRLSSRVEPITITRVDYGSRQCLGRRTLGRAVYYTPQPGFVGTDRFFYTSITQKGGPVPQTGTVMVR